MKILPIIDTRRIGGAGQQLIPLVKSLKSECDIPGVVVFNRQGSGPSEFIKALESNGINPIVVNERWAIDPVALISLHKLLAKHDPDVVETHGYKASFFIFILRCFRCVAKQTKWVAWIHGWTDENIKVKMYNTIGNLSVIFADLIICVSKSLSEKISAPRKKILVVHNGVDETYSSLPPPDLNEMRENLNIGNKKVIIVIGRYSFEKGQDRIPPIAYELKKRSKEAFVILLIGEGPEKNNLINLINEHGVSTEVMLHPYMTDIRPFYLLADVCFLPSRKEGMPNVILEALCMKCPVVSFDVGGVTEIIDHQKEGIVVKQGDLIGAAEAISHVLSNQELRDQLRLAGHEKIYNYFLSSSRSKQIYLTYQRLKGKTNKTTNS